jgi:hypothetical protein
MHMLGRLLCPCQRLFNSMAARSFSYGIWLSFWNALFYCLCIKDCVVFPTSNHGKLSTCAGVKKEPYYIGTRCCGTSAPIAVQVQTSLL